MFKKLINAIINTSIIIIVTLALLLVGVRVFGFEVFTVLSGSMEPTYHVGSLVYVKPTDEIEVNDVITFAISDDTVATHRVIDIIPDENGEPYYQTKGDANNTEDANPVHENNVVGKVIFSIPLLGYLANYIQSPPGIFVAIGVGAFLLLLSILPEIFKDDIKIKDE